MDLMDRVIDAAVVTAVGGILTFYMHGRFKDIERRWKADERRWEANEAAHTGMLAKLAEHDARFDGHDARFDGIDTRLASLERSVDGMRSDLTRVALAVGPGPEAQAGG
jgi:hypothetical protein